MKIELDPIIYRMIVIDRDIYEILWNIIDFFGLMSYNKFIVTYRYALLFIRICY